MARASAIRAFWPPDSVTPLSPISEKVIHIVNIFKTTASYLSYPLHRKRLNPVQERKHQ